MDLLFGIPGGGTTSVMYMGWRKYCRGLVEVVPMDVAGRGYKANQPAHIELEEMAKELADEICTKAEGKTYVIFGYCLGALLAYEVCKILDERNFPEPEHVFLCGAMAPCDKEAQSLFSRKECRSEISTMFYRFFPPYLFSDRETLDKVIKIYLEVLFEQADKTGEFMSISIEDERFVGIDADKKTLEYILQFSNSFCENFQKDQQAVLDYNKKEKEIKKIHCPVTMLCGKEDHIIELEKQMEWKDWIDGPFDVVMMDANHFNLTQDSKNIVEIIKERSHQV